MKKDLLFSVTAKDCRWDYYRASGPGGQHKNKTDSAVRCTHIESGAVGNCSEHRSQPQNKKVAFKRMAETDTFKNWIKLKSAEVTGKLREIEEKVDHEMKFNTKVEIKENGIWVKE